MKIYFSEASNLNNDIYGNCQLPIKMFLEKQGEMMEQVSMIPELFKVVESENFAERYASMTGMDEFDPVPEGGAYPDNGMQEGYHKDIFNDTQWMSRFTITEMMVEDGKLMDLTQKPAQFMQAYDRTREGFGAAVYCAAIAGQKTMKYRGKNFDVSCADGEALFAKKHKSILDKAFVQSNMFSDEFSAVNLGKLETRMQNFQGDAEEILQVAPTTILIPNDADLKEKVFAAIGTDKDPVTANNAFNYQYGRWQVLIWNYLNKFITPSSKPWILLDKAMNQTQGGAIWQDRIGLKVHSYQDENTGNNVWRGRARFNASFNNWRFAAAGGISGGDSL